VLSLDYSVTNIVTIKGLVLTSVDMHIDCVVWVMSAIVLRLPFV